VRKGEADMTLQNQRKFYGEALVNLGKENKDVVVLEADLGKSTMSILFQEAFPQRFFEMGIGEQNMASFAAGLALAGKKAFINSFAVFTTGRCFDQIRQSICTARLNVKIGGSSAGLSDFGDGATHQSVEDIAIMRALPNMTVLVPADGSEAAKAVKKAAEIEGPVYIRITRSEMPQVTDDHEPFDFAPAVLRQGSDLCIFACGIMVSKALAVAELLENEGISTKVVNVRCLKPLDENEIVRLCENIPAVVCCEEHSIIGGLSAAVAIALSSENKKMGYIAIHDKFGQSAHSAQELMQYYGLTEKDIFEKAKETITKVRVSQ
jgi:transketolase